MSLAGDIMTLPASESAEGTWMRPRVHACQLQCSQTRCSRRFFLPKLVLFSGSAVEGKH